ncbi:MAG TPA: hypothetical protein VGH28_27145 [Polyangiaceae bacterium]|jgi:hypothetical protein
MSTLHQTINALAEKFAHDLVRAMRGASLDEIVGETSAAHRRSSKRIRRSPEELQKLADKIVGLVAKHVDGIRAEELKRMMGVGPGNVGAKVFTKPLGIALASKKIRKKGARRATRYFAA